MGAPSESTGPGTQRKVLLMLPAKEASRSSTLGTVWPRRPEGCWRLRKVQKPRGVRDSV